MHGPLRLTQGLLGRANIGPCQANAGINEASKRTKTKKGLLGAAEGFLMPTQGLQMTEYSQAYKGPYQSTSGSAQADKGRLRAA